MKVRNSVNKPPPTVWIFVVRVSKWPLPITTGTDAEQTVDFASAYVQLTDKDSGQPLGTYLISQNFDVKNSDKVEVNGKTFFIDLRFKTDYKPFSMTLKDDSTWKKFTTSAVSIKWRYWCSPITCITATSITKKEMDRGETILSSWEL